QVPVLLPIVIPSFGMNVTGLLLIVSMVCTTGQSGLVTLVMLPAASNVNSHVHLPPAHVTVCSVVIGLNGLKATPGPAIKQGSSVDAVPPTSTVVIRGTLGAATLMCTVAGKDNELNLTVYS